MKRTVSAAALCLSFLIGTATTSVWLFLKPFLVPPKPAPKSLFSDLDFAPPRQFDWGRDTPSLPETAPSKSFSWGNPFFNKPGFDFEDILTNKNRLVYRDYVVTRTFKPDSVLTVTIRKGRHVLETLTYEDFPPGKDFVQFGVFSFLGGETKQLVVGNFSGGLHCCFGWRIYDLYPRFRLIFDGDDFFVGYQADRTTTIADLNRDGVFEFILDDGWYCYEFTVYVESPQPSVVFKYDPNEKRYFPANPEFRNFNSREIKTNLRWYSKTKRHWDASGGICLSVVLAYLYAGEDAKAWRFYRKEHCRVDESEFRQHLFKDKVYLALKARYPDLFRIAPNE